MVQRVKVRADKLQIADHRCDPDGFVVYKAIDGESVLLGFSLMNTSDVQQVRVPASGTFSVLRQGTCDQPVCYFCCREPDDDVHHCMDHWSLPA